MIPKRFSSPSWRWAFLALVIVLAVGLPLFWMAGGWPFPDDSQEPVIKGDWNRLTPETRPTGLRLLTYNIHYGAGMNPDLAKPLTLEQIKANLDGIARVINQLGVDAVLLQEVDFDSARTHGLNQMEYLARATRLGYMAPVPTWVKGYLPYPLWPPFSMLGRLDSGQVVLSRWPIKENRRLALPKPAEWFFLYRAFYLARAIQKVTLDVGGTPVTLINIHSESGSLPNRQIHAEMIRDFVRPLTKGALVMAGDFNAVPPEAAKKNGFGDEPDLDQRSDKSIATIRSLNLRETIPPDRYHREEPISLTFPADKPTRRLDYLFFSDAFYLGSGHVMNHLGPLSDHRPIFAELLFSR